MAANDESKYEVRVRCHNCKRTSRVEVEKGSPVTSEPCPDCGVKALEVSPEPTL